MLFLLDTNIISFFMEGNQTVANNFVQCLYAGNSIKIPSIAYYEIQRGLLYKNAKRLQSIFDEVCRYYGIIDITTADMYRGAFLYSELKKAGTLLEDDDILIGAMALERNAILTTNNTKHLERLQGIQLADWTLPWS